MRRGAGDSWCTQEQVTWEWGGVPYVGAWVWCSVVEVFRPCVWSCVAEEGLSGGLGQECPPGARPHDPSS